MSMLSDNLLLEQANLTILTNGTAVLYLWAQAVECFMCGLLNRLVIKNNTESIVFETDKSWNLILLDNENNTVCSENDVTFGHGYYVWNVSTSCSPISQNTSPPNELIPIFYTFGSLILSALLWRYCKFVCRYRSFLNRRFSEAARSEIECDLGSPSDIHELLRSNIPVPKEKPHRIKSLDAFRGITIVMMIFVNYGGGGYWFFEHSPWNGVTIADFIFPWFAWIMGVGLAIKVKSELRSIVPRCALFNKICLRSFTLIILGLILTNLRNDDLDTIRIPGVLQRLGVAYFIVGTVESQFMKPQADLQNARFAIIEDLLESYRQWIIIGFLTGLHIAITFFLPVPDCPTGYLGPGGLHDNSLHYNCTGGAAGFIDRFIFNNSHIYQRPTCQSLYDCPLPYDPEGLLGALTTILCVYLGVHAGRIVLVFKKTTQRIKRWLLWFFITSISAGILCKFSKEDGLIPLNKNLWSLSYVLLCCSVAFLLISVLLFVIDKRKWWSGSPFHQAGMNSILLYIGHVITKQTLPWQWKITDQTTHLWYLVMDVWATILWVLVAVVLYRKRIFVTI